MKEKKVGEKMKEEGEQLDDRKLGGKEKKK